MDRKLTLVIRISWGASFLLDLFSGMVGLSPKVALFLPVIYLSLSFLLFNRLVIGFRVFHHLCLIVLVAYYLLGLVSSAADVFDPSLVVSHMAYSWFSGIAVAYLVFCFMLLIVYAPYAAYQRFQTRPGKNSN